MIRRCQKHGMSTNSRNGREPPPVFADKPRRLRQDVRVRLRLRIHLHFWVICNDGVLVSSGRQCRFLCAGVPAPGCRRKHTMNRNSRDVANRAALAAARLVSQGVCSPVVLARLRSEGSQFSGGNAMRQKTGDGSVNSTPTSAFAPSFCPRYVTVQVNSSTVFVLMIVICWPRATFAARRTMQPCALTEIVWVSSWKFAPSLAPRTINPIAI